jgi:hypothetical protein
VRAYDDLVSGAIAGLREQPAGALRRLRLDQHGGYETPVLDALESVVTTTKAPAPLESTLA